MEIAHVGWWRDKRVRQGALRVQLQNISIVSRKDDE